MVYSKVMPIIGAMLSFKILLLQNNLQAYVVFFLFFFQVYLSLVFKMHLEKTQYYVQTNKTTTATAAPYGETFQPHINNLQTKFPGGPLVFEVGYHPRKKNHVNYGCFSGPGNVHAYIV